MMKRNFRALPLIIVFSSVLAIAMNRPGDLYNRISALPSTDSVISADANICYLKYPLKGAFDRRTFDSAAIALSTIFTKTKPAAIIGKAALDSCLSKKSGFRGCGYCLLPLEIASVAREKKMSVGNFVKLNKDGDFVPSQTAHTLTARETETRLRFVLLDLTAQKIVVDLNEKRTGGTPPPGNDTIKISATGRNEKIDIVKENIGEIISRIKIKLREKLSRNKEEKQ
jgi:hypothetical protein